MVSAHSSSASNRIMYCGPHAFNFMTQFYRTLTRPTVLDTTRMHRHAYLRSDTVFVPAQCAGLHVSINRWIG